MQHTAQTPPVESAGSGMRRGRHGLIDTSPEAEKVMIELLRGMSISQRLARVCALTRAARQLALADLRRLYPADSPRELLVRLAARLYPPDLVRAAYGYVPEARRSDVVRSD